jgi:hypothetical protein
VKPRPFGRKIFSPERAMVHEVRGGGSQVPCNRCHVASAKVEVITRTVSVFVCSGHHKMHHNAILAAGHQVRAGLSLDL